MSFPHSGTHGSRGIVIGENWGEIDGVTLDGPGVQIGTNFGTIRNVTFGGTNVLPMHNTVQSSQHASSSLDQSHLISGQSSVQPSGEEAGVSAMARDNDLIEGWQKHHREGKLDAEPTREISVAREERAYFMGKLQRALWRHLNIPQGVRSATSEVQSLRGAVKSTWLKECQKWVVYIQDKGKALVFVESVLSEEALTGLDPFGANDDDVKTILRMLPEHSTQRAVLAQLLSCDRMRSPRQEVHGDALTLPSASGKMTVTLHPVRPDASSSACPSTRYQATVDGATVRMTLIHP